MSALSAAGPWVNASINPEMRSETLNVVPGVDSGVLMTSTYKLVEDARGRYCVARACVCAYYDGMTNCVNILPSTAIDWRDYGGKRVRATRYAEINR